MTPYKLSKNYERLADLIEEGHRIACVTPDGSIAAARLLSLDERGSTAWTMETANHSIIRERYHDAFISAIEENCPGLGFIDPEEGMDTGRVMYKSLVDYCGTET